MNSKSCVFAISRRFSVPWIDALTQEYIEPALARHGLSLTCTWAEDDPNHPDHWINRMGFIFDLADVHVIIDLDRSGNTMYEFEASNLSNYSTDRFFLYCFLGLRSSQKVQQFRIIVHDQSGRYKARSPTYFSDPLKLGRSKVKGLTLLVRYDDREPEAFAQAFSLAVDQVISAVLMQDELLAKREAEGEAGSMLGPDVWNVPLPGEPLLKVEHFRRLRLALARRMLSREAKPIKLAHEIAAYQYLQSRLDSSGSEGSDWSILPASNDSHFGLEGASGRSAVADVHDAESMAEYACWGVEFGKLAKRAIESPDNRDLKEDVLVAALAFRFVVANNPFEWRRADYLDMHRKLTRSRIVRGVLRLMTYLGPI